MLHRLVASGERVSQPRKEKQSVEVWKSTSYMTGAHAVCLEGCRVHPSLPLVIPPRCLAKKPSWHSVSSPACKEGTEFGIYLS